MNKVLTVSQINTYIKSLIDGSDILSHVYIGGEISNLTDHYRSGHIYLSIKDEKSVIKAVMFATAARRLRFSPKDGMKVLVRGKISVYEQTGQYQLYIEDMQPDGLGALNLAFEQLKEKLFSEGLFSLKKTLPIYPNKIAVITSPTGAAVQDIFRILGRRWPVAEIQFYPCAVQGDKAVPELIAAIREANNGDADVIIIGRGGGSIEDLWAFNSEDLARAISVSQIPVVSAVGHETDYTICDFVADLRASTPSAAAELITPDIKDEEDKVVYAMDTLKRAVGAKISDAYQRLDSLPEINDLIKLKLEDKINRARVQSRELELFSGKKLLAEKSRFETNVAKLDALSPLKVLSRGYSVLMSDDKPIVDIKAVELDQNLTAILNNGKLTVKVIDKEKSI